MAALDDVLTRMEELLGEVERLDEPTRGRMLELLDGIDIEVLDVRGGVVSVHLSGACGGCTASAITLREGVERALREKLPGFVALEAREDQAAAHPPPGPSLLQIENQLD